MIRLVLSNSYAVEFGTLKNVLSDPATTLSNDKTSSSQKLSVAPSKSPPTDTLIAARLQNSEKKKAKCQIISGCLNIAKRSKKTSPKSSILLPIIMELIKPSKQRV